MICQHALAHGSNDGSASLVARAGAAHIEHTVPVEIMGKSASVIFVAVFDYADEREPPGTFGKVLH